MASITKLPPRPSQRDLVLASLLLAPGSKPHG
jgi:hypothetical protein